MIVSINYNSSRSKLV